MSNEESTTRKIYYPEMTGNCPVCEGIVHVLADTRNKPGDVCDGDTVECCGCGKQGIFCGSPSDGIGVDWSEELQP